jgi:hypothetical protein
MKLVACCALIAVAFAGCSAGETKTVTVSEAASGTKVRSDNEDGCEALGIDIRGSREGTCRQDGTRFHVANRANPIRLKELSARLIDEERLTALPDGYSRANGTYVVLTLAITNRTSAPRSVEDQIALHIDRKEYGRDDEAEIYYEDSFNMLNEIQPDETLEGRIVFDLPPSALEKLSSRRAGSNLVILNFSEALGFDSDRPSEVGAIRLWQ